MARICSSVKRKLGILVVGRKSVGFFSQTGIQFLFSFRRTSLRLGPTFFMSCSRLLVVRSSCMMRRSTLLFSTFRATARSFRRSEEHTSELQSLTNLVCRLLLEKKNYKTNNSHR